MKSVRQIALAAGVAVALVVAVLAGLSAPTSAQEYTPRCSVSAEYDADAGVLRVFGTNLAPGFTTPIFLDGDEIGEATADANGAFVAEIPVDLGPDGEIQVAAVHTVSILCSEDGDESSTEVDTDPPLAHVIEPATIDCAGNLRGYAALVEPGSEVTFTLDHTDEELAAITADSEGTAAYAVVVDLDPGTYTVTARGLDGLGDPFTMTSSFTVPSGCGNPLPRTGTDSVSLALVGLAAVGLGSLTLLIARRRGSSAA